MKLGTKSDYCIMKKGVYGIYYEPIYGRKIILKKNNKLLYVGYTKNDKWFDFTDLETGFLIHSDSSYTMGIKWIFINFDEIRSEIDSTKHRLLQEVNQLQIANDIFRFHTLQYNESVVIENV